MKGLCGRYGIWIVSLSSCSRLSSENGRGGGCLDLPQTLSRSQKLICSTMRVNFIIGKYPSDLSSAYEMEGSAIRISRVSLRTWPKPTYSANIMISFSKERKCTESPLKIGRFSLHGIPARDSLSGTAPLAPASAGDR